MTRKGMTFASVAIILLMAAGGAAVAARLPADALLPTHWGFTGEADRFAGKWQALTMMPVFAGLIALLFHSLPRLEPLREGLERSQGFYLSSWAGMLILFALLQTGIVGIALGWPLSVPRLATGGLGLCLALMGNQFGKSRRMYLGGIRTPWTLASENVWIKTHRLGGKLFVAAGLIMAAAALSPLRDQTRLLVLVVAVLVSVTVPTVYSFVAWRKEQGDGASR